MSSDNYDSPYKYKTKIWLEEPESDNPFAANKAYCHGYDVYNEILSKASWFEYLYLMFKGEKPTPDQTWLLEKMAIGIANVGPREASVRAAMNGGVAGSPHAASLMTSLAVGAGQYGGGHEIYLLMNCWSSCGEDFDLFLSHAKDAKEKSKEVDIWPEIEHIPGFDPNGVSLPGILKSLLGVLTGSPIALRIKYLSQNQKKLQSETGYPISLTAIISAAFADLGFNEHEACMLFLMLRLPGAAAHAIEQRGVGWKNFPFYADAISINEDPGEREIPDVSRFGL